MSTNSTLPDPAYYKNGYTYFNKIWEYQYPVKALDEVEITAILDKESPKFDESSYVIMCSVLFNSQKAKQFVSKNDTTKKNAQTVKENPSSAKTPKSKSGKIDKFECIPEWSKDYNSASFKLAIGTFLVTEMANSFKKNFMVTLFNNHDKIKNVDRVVEMCKKTAFVKQFIEKFGSNKNTDIRPFMKVLIEVSNLTKWKHCAEIARAIDENMYNDLIMQFLNADVNSDGLQLSDFRPLQRITPYEPIIKDLINNWIYPFEQNFREMEIRNTFKLNNKGTIFSVIKELEEKRAKANTQKKVNELDDNTLYQYYIGDPGYLIKVNHLTTTLNGHEYGYQELGGCNYDVVAQDRLWLEGELSWKQRLSMLDNGRPPVPLHEGLGHEIKNLPNLPDNQGNFNKDVTVFWQIVNQDRVTNRMMSLEFRTRKSKNKKTLDQTQDLQSVLTEE